MSNYKLIIKGNLNGFYREKMYLRCRRFTGIRKYDFVLLEIFWEYVLC